jgi:signal transduction histidine kinase
MLALMTAATAAAFGAVTVRDTSNGWLAAGGLGLIEAGFTAAAGAYFGMRRALVGALRERADRAEHERETRAQQAKLAERARLAREMHDVLAHKVSLIAMHAGALEVSPATDPAEVRRMATLIRTTARQAMEDLRDVLGVLRTGDDGDGDLLPQPRLADVTRAVEASRQAGVDVELIMEVADVPDTLARTVYRIVQEGLTNVHKHALGAATTVTVTGDRGRGVTVAVVNRRPISHVALLPGSGRGLVGLTERVALVGGTLHSRRCADDGWQLTAWLPWT